jgi:DNA adenine methylase
MISLTSTKRIAVLSSASKQAAVEIREDQALKPPLKWAGGKRWQLPYLRILWEGNSQRRLVEPFAGGLAVTLGLRPTSALLNDINPHVINFYRYLKAGLQIDLTMVN